LEGRVAGGVALTRADLALSSRKATVTAVSIIATAPTIGPHRFSLPILSTKDILILSSA
jgi:hypothetical protein